MKAAVIHKYGGPEELKFEDFPDPVLESGEVLVKTCAASVNPIDLKMRSGAVKDYFPVIFPGILGLDVSGIISAVGSGVKSFSIGEKVFAHAPKAYATLCAIKANELAKVPDAMDLASAAALPTVTTTGAQLADLALGSGKEATVLVLGAIGNVGRSAVYRLKEHSATVIAGVLKKQAAEAKKTGADSIVALDDDQELEGLPRLDAVADTINGATAAKLVHKLKSGGVFASVLGPPSNAAERPDVTFKTMRVKSDPRLLLEMAGAVRSGQLAIPMGKSFPLKEASAAHAAAESGSAGKILLVA
jgi:NADPH:quinone reductase-like Zn-dependent oxidoreductase